MLARARRGGRPHPTRRAARRGRHARRSGWSAPAGSSPATAAGCPRPSTPTRTSGSAGWPPRRRTTAWPPSAAESAVRDLVAAVVDALPRGATPGALTSTFRRRLDAELVRPRPTGSGARRAARPGHHLAARRGRRGGAGRRARSGWCSRCTTSSTRCTCATRRCCGPARPEDHGFGERARTHAAIALRAAAHAWPVLDRLLELRVPDEITLDTDELVSLLDDGVARPAAGRRRRAVAAQPRPRPDDAGHPRAPRRAARRRTR